MKTNINDLRLVSGLTVALWLIPGGLPAQTFTTLHSFGDPSGLPDGFSPVAGLVLSGSTLHGTAAGGGTSTGGTIFSMNTDGTGFTVLYDFSGADGGDPYGGLTLSASALYGTTLSGGDYDNGTVFVANMDGSGFSTLYSFSASAGFSFSTNSDGYRPSAPLLLVGNALYGTTSEGGLGGGGTVFTINTDGTGFTNLHYFSGPTCDVCINADGGEPWGGLVPSSNTLFGTTAKGGTFGGGTVFALNMDGTGFRTIHSFTNADNRRAGLVLSGNTLFGTTLYSGNGVGTVFAVNIDGTGFKILHSFAGCCGPSRNADGEFPEAQLIVSGNTLFGTATYGGTWGDGTVFAVNTDGTGFKVVHTFTPTSGTTGANVDGSVPVGGLVFSGNTLYGTAEYGGAWGNGTVFSISLPPLSPELTITSSAASVILSWPTNAIGFALQSTTNLGSAAIWTTNSLGPIVVNGLNTVTNRISGARQFYRLSQ